MAYENNEKKMGSVYSQRVRAGKRRTYFFDVRETRGSDFYLTITESRKRFDSDGYERHKIFLYKEDFNKFIKGLGEAIDYVKTELMPDFDFDAFNHDTPYEGDNAEQNNATAAPAAQVTETPVAEVSETTAAPETQAATEIPTVEEVAEKMIEETPSETNDGPVDNGSAEIAEKW